MQGFPSFCLHDKVPSGESKLKVLILAKAGCSALFFPILLAKSLTISCVQGLLSGPVHFKAPTDPCPLAAPPGVVFVVACNVGFVVGCDVGSAVGCDVGSVVGCDVGFIVGFDVGFVVGFDVGVDVVCPIICKAAAKHSTTVAIMMRFIGVFLLCPSVSRRR